MRFALGLVEEDTASAINTSSASMTFFSVISQKYECAKLYEDIKPTFGSDNLELTVDAVVGVSLFQIFCSIISAAIANNKLKENKNER